MLYHALSDKRRPDFVTFPAFSLMWDSWKHLVRKALLPIIILHHQKKSEQEQWELFPEMMRKALFGLSFGTMITTG